MQIYVDPKNGLYAGFVWFLSAGFQYCCVPHNNNCFRSVFSLSFAQACPEEFARVEYPYSLDEDGLGPAGDYFEEVGEHTVAAACRLLEYRLREGVSVGQR